MFKVYALPRWWPGVSGEAPTLSGPFTSAPPSRGIQFCNPARLCCTVFFMVVGIAALMVFVESQKDYNEALSAYEAVLSPVTFNMSYVQRHEYACATLGSCSCSPADPGDPTCDQMLAENKAGFCAGTSCCANQVCNTCCYSCAASGGVADCYRCGSYQCQCQCVDFVAAEQCSTNAGTCYKPAISASWALPSGKTASRTWTTSCGMNDEACVASFRSNWREGASFAGYAPSNGDVNPLYFTAIDRAAGFTTPDNVHALYGALAGLAVVAVCGCYCFLGSAMYRHKVLACMVPYQGTTSVTHSTASSLVPPGRSTSSTAPGLPPSVPAGVGAPLPGAWPMPAASMRQAVPVPPPPRTHVTSLPGYSAGVPSQVPAGFPMYHHGPMAQPVAMARGATQSRHHHDRAQRPHTPVGPEPRPRIDVEHLEPPLGRSHPVRQPAIISDDGNPPVASAPMDPEAPPAGDVGLEEPKAGYLDMSKPAGTRRMSGVAV